mmetsp:Transcript_76704/g.204783  ORF Transcript_76704/g.204783 Transcript_76704/m.204783 type:complete len:261 (+) Transcript_76704:43-825(+)
MLTWTTPTKNPPEHDSKRKLREYNPSASRKGITLPTTCQIRSTNPAESPRGHTVIRTSQSVSASRTHTSASSEPSRPSSSANTSFCTHSMVSLLPRGVADRSRMDTSEIAGIAGLRREGLVLPLRPPGLRASPTSPDASSTGNIGILPRTKSGRASTAPAASLAASLPFPPAGAGGGGCPMHMFLDVSSTPASLAATPSCSAASPGPPLRPAAATGVTYPLPASHDPTQVAGSSSPFHPAGRSTKHSSGRGLPLSGSPGV